MLITTNGYEALDMLRQSILSSSQMLQSKGPVDSETAVAASKEGDRDTGGEAQVPAARHIDIALVDIQMPIIDGLQVLRAYHSSLASLAPPIQAGSVDNAAFTSMLPVMVAMSANADQVTMQDAYAAGAAYQDT